VLGELVGTESQPTVATAELSFLRTSQIIPLR
jgi:hypothetical protein